MPTRPPTTPNRRVQTARRLASCILLFAALAGCQEGMVDLEERSTNESTCAAATPITMGQSLGGSLAEGDCSQGGIWVDRWSLDLASETSVRIDLASTFFDAFLELHSAGGGLIAQNDDAGSLDSRIIETLPAGSYVIVARSLGQGQSGAYRLSVTVGPDCSSRGAVTIGQHVSGTLDSGSCLFEWGGLMESWSFDLRVPTGVRIEVESSDFDEALVVTDDNGNIEWVLDGFGPLGHARGDLQLAAGSWTLSAISIYENPGSYELRVDLMPPCLTGKSLVLGETLAGTIDEADCLLYDWAPADSLVLELDRDTPLDFVVKSSDFAPFLHVRDQTGNEVVWAPTEYNPGTGMPTGIARTSVVLDAGFYSVYVASEGYPSAWGDYEITVSEVVCDVTDELALDTLVTGTLESGDCLGAGGAYQDPYRFVVPADTTIQIDLESGAFDAYLTLKDSAGAVLATDDDGGAKLNSRIQITLAAGTYVVEAGARTAGEAGVYNLSIATSAPSPAPARSISTLPSAPKVLPNSRSRMDVEFRSRDRLQRVIDRLWGRAGKAVGLR